MPRGIWPETKAPEKIFAEEDKKNQEENFYLICNIIFI